MLVPSAINFIWPSTVASIPQGWERNTAFDGIYPKGTADSVNPNETGGALTHSHTSPEHTHAISHVHTGRTQDADTSGGWSVNCGNANEGVCQAFHYHSFTSHQPTGGSLHDAISYASVNHEPSNRTVLFIKPSVGLSPLRTGIVGLFGSSTVPTGWSFCDGTNTTPDLRNRYLKGAPTGQDSDVATDNGSLQHTHVVDHSHTLRSHTHDGTTDGATADERTAAAGGDVNQKGHVHTFSLDAQSPATSGYIGNVTSANVEPSYKKLLAIKNTSAGNSLPVGIIGMYLGSLTTIPIGWFLCDGNGGRIDMRGFHLKIANEVAEVGNVGGSNTHVHASSNSHTHLGTSHTHAVPGMAQVAGTYNPRESGYAAIAAYHIHNQGNGQVVAATPIYADATIEADSVNSEPPYRTVAFIQYKYSTGGLPLLTLL